MGRYAAKAIKQDLLQQGVRQVIDVREAAEFDAAIS